MAKKQFFILASILIGFFILLKVGYVLNNANFIHIYTDKEQGKMDSETVSDAVEFIYTDKEQRDVEKWKNKPMHELCSDARNGDRAALYNLGMYFLLGLDFPIDVKMANTFFAKSASLGFAPALNEIAQMYINDELNVFLELIYINLTISFGHTEFIRDYYNLRGEIIKVSVKNGQRIMNEIERIAFHKKAIILKNQKSISCKQNNIKADRIYIENITDEDWQYDNDYWLDFYNGENRVLDFSEIKERDSNYLDQLHGVYYKSITSDVMDLDVELKMIVDEMKKDSYSNFEIEKLKKQAQAHAKKNYKYFCKIESDAKEARKNIQVLKEYKDSI